MKKEWSLKHVLWGVIVCSFLLFMWCDLLPPTAGMGGADYYQIASGGFFLNSANGCQTFFSAIPCEESYRGTMNWLLRPISRAFGCLDVRFLSTLSYLAVIALFVFFLKKLTVEKLWHKCLAAGVFLFVFFDFSYLLHLNSLNAEGAFLALLLVMMLLLLLQFYQKTTLWKTVCYLALAFVAAGIKTQYFWVGMGMALLIFPTFFLRKDWIYRLVTAVLVLAVCLGSFACFGGGIYPIKEQENLFHSVYYGVLKDSQDLSAAAALGLSQDAMQYAGKTCYEVDQSVLNDSRYHSSYAAVAGYYLTHPKAFWSKMERSADNAYEIRQQYISNYPGEHKIKNGFHLYSALKRRFIQPDFWFVLVFLAAILAFSAVQMKKGTHPAQKAHYLMLILLSILTLGCFVMPVLISGEASLSKELFLYNFFFDILLCHVVIGGVIILRKRREAVQQKFGVQQ